MNEEVYEYALRDDILREEYRKMNNDIIKFKEELISTGIFKRVHTFQYKCKMCPYCDDAKYHCYVIIKMDDITPVMYNCKKCNKGGWMNYKFLEYYGINDIKIPKFKGKNTVRKRGKNKGIELIKDEVDCSFVKNYISKRLKVDNITNEELTWFQYIVNPFLYVVEDRGVANTPNLREYFNKEKRHWFCLSNGNIIGRNEDDKDGWLRFKGMNTDEGKALYIIKKPFDPCEKINVYISEGIFDSLGLYMLFGRESYNNVFISVLGRDYEKGIDYMIDSGIFGDHIHIKICKDNDVGRIYIDRFKRMMFGSVSIYQNMNGKDYGDDIHNIDFNKIESL